MRGSASQWALGPVLWLTAAASLLCGHTTTATVTLKGIHRMLEWQGRTSRVDTAVAFDHAGVSVGLGLHPDLCTYLDANLFVAYKAKFAVLVDGVLTKRFTASRGAGTYRLWTPKSTLGFAPSLHPDDVDAASTAGSLGVVLTNSSGGQGAGGDNLSASTGGANWASSDSSVDSSSSASTSTVRVELVKDNEFYLDKQPAISMLIRMEANTGCIVSAPSAPPVPAGFSRCTRKTRPLRIEFLGDSTIAGWGANGCTDALFGSEYFTKAFPFTLCQAVGAQCHSIVRSGGMMRYTNYKYSDGFNAVLEDAWLRTLGSDRKENTWRPQSWVPDLVAISIGRNDFNRGEMSAASTSVQNGWGDSLGDFLNQLLQAYGPDTAVAVILGPWVQDDHTTQVLRALARFQGPLGSVLDLRAIPKDNLGGCIHHPDEGNSVRMTEVALPQLEEIARQVRAASSC